MKKIILSILCICVLSIQVLMAQLKTNDNEAKEAREQVTDKFIVDIFHDLWQDVPPGVDLRAIQQGISLSAMYNINLFESNFSVAAGLGISCHNLYSNAVPTRNFQDVNDPIISAKTIFVSLNQYYNKEIDYDRNKLSLTYLEIPMEFRFKTNPVNDRPFRISLGAKVSYNINNHTKYKGEDVVENTNETIILKKHNIPGIADWSYGVFARIGYGHFNLYAAYSLSKIFKEDEGPQIYPISIGLAIIPF